MGRHPRLDQARADRRQSSPVFDRFLLLRIIPFIGRRLVHRWVPVAQDIGGIRYAGRCLFSQDFVGCLSQEVSLEAWEYQGVVEESIQFELTDAATDAEKVEPQTALIDVSCTHGQ